MKFEFIPDDEQGDIRKTKTKKIIIIATITSLLASLFIFKFDISSLVGSALYKSDYVEFSIPFLEYTASNGNRDDMLLLSTLTDNTKDKNFSNIGIKWLNKMSSEGHSPSNFKIATFYENGSFGFAKDFNKAADYYDKALKTSESSDITKNSSDFLIKYYMSNPDPNFLDISSSKENRINFSRQYAKAQFEKNDYSNSKYYALSYINSTPQEMNKEESLKKATDILSIGISNGQSLNGLLGDTYIKLYNLTGDKTFIFGAINSFNLSAEDKKDPFYSVSKSTVSSLSQKLRD